MVYDLTRGGGLEWANIMAKVNRARRDSVGRINSHAATVRQLCVSYLLEKQGQKTRLP